MAKIDRRVPVLGMVLAYILAVGLVAAPNWREARRLERERAAAQHSLDNLLEINARYQRSSSGLKGALRPDGATGLLTVAQQTARQLNISEKLKSAVPVYRELTGGLQAEGFDLRLEGLNTEEAVRLAEALQREDGFYLDRLALERSRDGLSLSARLRFLALKKEAGPAR
ncbi:MAG TPA: hypothetical protein PKN80_05650 [bacterium]|uniref:Uncharacterized protein n=1 Tax=candidate division TA06 bacterium ADurb.Bin417 TaxID=1852828 RepID=A0A1V5MKX4_UNCT6|nr:MAG: hypothetical protein BWY73_00057 [candidate division TA06 bacterium ADurb.Bin417]HNQ35532.1 hypothetical protein [bacterium]HNS48230.1 hypothetical protein [bacterium]